MPAHWSGSVGRNRLLSVCDGSRVTNIYLNPHNQSNFEKSSPIGDLDPSCAPLGQNGDQKNQSAAVSFKIAIRG